VLNINQDEVENAAQNLVEIIKKQLFPQPNLPPLIHHPKTLSHPTYDSF